MTPKKIVQHHRTWVPFISIGFTIIAVGGFFFFTSQQKQTFASEFTEIQEQKNPLSSQEYQKIVSEMYNEVDIWTAYYMHQALLEMRIPAEYKDFHFRLVVATQKMVEGDVDSARRDFSEMELE
ncbi:hypothetical protein KJ766_03360, partial [Patescibacteria group bacterium]|nr:hypothetical protein [Patescibacteria group bacterium]